MIPVQIFRLIHRNSLLLQAKKSPLQKLRKKTGYTLQNCKKALQLYENDMEKAEQWLREQAQQHGWTQAAKLEGRNTSQGLITTIVDKQFAALAEINCETDFVAQNEKFHGLAKTVAATVLKYVKTYENLNELQRSVFYGNNLKSLIAADGKSLGDHSALTIGDVGENINLRRALAISVYSPNVTVSGCTHPMSMNPTVPVAFGKYGALIAVKDHKKREDIQQLSMQLCQHIIGMDPQKIGNPQVDEPHNNVDEEPCMIYQEFLLDPSLSVQQLLVETGIEIVDFARFEVGENFDEEPVIEHMNICG